MGLNGNACHLLFCVPPLAILGEFHRLLTCVRPINNRFPYQRILLAPHNLTCPPSNTDCHLHPSLRSIGHLTNDGPPPHLCQAGQESLSNTECHLHPQAPEDTESLSSNMSHHLLRITGMRSPQTHNAVVAVEMSVRALRLRIAILKANPVLQFQLIQLDDPSMNKIVHIFCHAISTPNI